MPLQCTQLVSVIIFKQYSKTLVCRPLRITFQAQIQCLPILPLNLNILLQPNIGPWYLIEVELRFKEPFFSCFPYDFIIKINKGRRDWRNHLEYVSQLVTYSSRKFPTNMKDGVTHCNFAIKTWIINSRWTKTIHKTPTGKPWVIPKRCVFPIANNVIYV